MKVLKVVFALLLSTLLVSSVSALEAAVAAEQVGQTWRIPSPYSVGWKSSPTTDGQPAVYFDPTGEVVWQPPESWGAILYKVKAVDDNRLHVELAYIKRTEGGAVGAGLYLIVNGSKFVRYDTGW